MTPATSRIVTRLIAGGLILGAMLGVYAEVTQHFQVVDSHTVKFASKVLPAIAMWIASGMVGAWLWLEPTSARRWAAIVLVLQVPIFATKIASFYWYSLAQVGILLAFSPKGLLIQSTARLGAGISYWVGGVPSQTAIGVNVFALVALWFLLRAKQLKTVTSDRAEAGSP